MIIIEVAGGLGNQLQQWALYRKFLSIGASARLDTSWFENKTQKKIAAKRTLELSLFERLEYEACTPKEKAALIGSDSLAGKLSRRLSSSGAKLFTETSFYHPEIFAFSDMYLRGYFACEKYYADILPFIREHIAFPKSPNPLNEKAACSIDQCEAVAIHIRRGDYLTEENAVLFGGICTNEYYASAIDYISQRVPQARFFLFSDDGDYIREAYQGERFTHIDWNRGADSVFDLFLMARCKHIICANSTFSFWGARLMGNKDKIMIRPLRHRNNLVVEAETLMAHWPGWTIIDSDGKAAT